VLCGIGVIGMMMAMATHTAADRVFIDPMCACTAAGKQW